MFKKNVCIAEVYNYMYDEQVITDIVKTVSEKEIRVFYTLF